MSFFGLAALVLGETVICDSYINRPALRRGQAPFAHLKSLWLGTNEQTHEKPASALPKCLKIPLPFAKFQTTSVYLSFLGWTKSVWCLLWTNQTIAPLKMLSSSSLFIIIYHPCHVLCFFHAQRTGRCFPSARFLNFRSQKKKKKKETIKNEEMHSVSGSGTDPHVQVCACMRSLEPEPMASPFLRLLAASEKRLLGLQRVTSAEHGSWGSCTPWEQKTCLGRYSDAECLDELAQTQASVQVCFSQKPFFIPLASCLLPISPLPVSSSESPVPSQLLSLHVGWLPDGSDKQCSWLSSPHHVRLLDQTKWPRTIPR